MEKPPKSALQIVNCRAVIPPLKTVINDIGVIEIMSHASDYWLATKQRVEGFYWTRATDDSSLAVRQWIIGRDRQGWWASCVTDDLYRDLDIVVLGERLEPPE